MTHRPKINEFNSLRTIKALSMSSRRKRERWATRERNFLILHNLLTENKLGWDEDESYWEIFEEIEDYFLDLEEGHHDP